MAAVLKKRALAEYSTVLQDQPPTKQIKKLRLVKKSRLGGSAAAYVGLLEKCKSSNEALQLLLRISDSLHFQEDELGEMVRKLAEHYHDQAESAVRVKVLALFADIGSEPGANVKGIINETFEMIKNETSHKVLTQALATLLKLGKVLGDNTTVQLELVNIAKQYLSDTSHSVKRKCLDLIGEMVALGDGSSEGGVAAMLKLVGDYTHSQDPRVRSAAFKTMLTMHERGLTVDAAIYSNTCQALSDDYEVVRQAALKLVWLIGTTYPENSIVLEDGEQEVRLVDDVFGKICSSVTDLSMAVRTQACRLLGSMTQVSDKFLQQTLDKKLMSNMRKKCSAHELAWENVTSGEWASGKKWADDAPREMVQAGQVQLMSSGACGALVHGLEDQFLEVRSAAVDAICSLSLDNPQFAVLSLDFLVDMFNDEIEDVRIKAIDSLIKISRHIVLREDQLETILGALEDFSMDVREGLHRMLASCRLSTKGSLQMCVESLLDNLKKYPQDRKSTWRCLQSIGYRHPELTLPLVPQLLAIHPFLDTPEPDVEDPAYISVLILVFNAAQSSPTMLQLFEKHTVKHYSYLRDTMPHLVPQLKVLGPSRSLQLPATVPPATSQFLCCLLDQLEAAPSGGRVRSELLTRAESDLSRLALIDSAGAGAAQFTALYISSQVLMDRVLADKMWYSNSATAMRGNLLKNSIAQLLQHSLKLQHLFVNLRPEELASVKQLKLKALALQLVYIVTASNLSALSLSQHMLYTLQETHRYLTEHSLPLDGLTARVLKEMSGLEEAKPGAVARCLLPLLQESAPAPPPRPTNNVRMSRAVITSPTGSMESALKFTGGLVMGVALEAELYNLCSTDSLRLRIKYPDQQAQTVVPPRSHIRPYNNEAKDGSEPDYRLITTALISHQVWTEACYVDISLVLDLSETEPGLSQTAHKVQTLNPCLMELCKPVKVYVSPKPVKRGI